MNESRLLNTASAGVPTSSFASAHSVTYSIIDLGTLGDTQSIGQGINDSRHAAGDRS